MRAILLRLVPGTVFVTGALLLVASGWLHTAPPALTPPAAIVVTAETPPDPGHAETPAIVLPAEPAPDLQAALAELEPLPDLRPLLIAEPAKPDPPPPPPPPRRRAPVQIAVALPIERPPPPPDASDVVGPRWPTYLVRLREVVSDWRITAFREGQ